MRNFKTTHKIFAGVAAVGLGIALAIPTPAEAGRFGFSIGTPGTFFWYNTPHRVYRGPGYYYPIYNPVVERDVHYDGHFHRDGTHHGERVVEDRHASFYSPGRNEAITRPRTTVERYGGYGYNGERERTSWIGADGRPHSTTVDRVTTVDPWGNSHTDTRVTLKNKKGGDAPKTEVTTPGAKVPIEGGAKTPKRIGR